MRSYSFKMSQSWTFGVSHALVTYPYAIFTWTTIAGISLYLIRRYVGRTHCSSKATLDGKTAIITGGNTGIGLETAIDFVQRNGRVVLACRSRERGEAAVKEVKRRIGNNNVVFMQLDLASLDSIRNFAASVLDKEARIDILVNNAGVMACPYTKTADGFEMQFGVNHLGHFLLTNLLLDRLKEAPSARIVNVSALAYKAGKINFDDINSTHKYSSLTAYCQSKLANILFTLSLAKRLEGTRVTVNALHPGVIRTELGRHFNTFLQLLAAPLMFLIFKTPWQGAQTTIYCAVSEEMEGVSGQFLSECTIQKLLPRVTHEADAEKLWKISVQMVGLNKKQ